MLAACMCLCVCVCVCVGVWVYVGYVCGCVGGWVYVWCVCGCKANKMEILQGKCYTVKNGVVHYTPRHYAFPVIKTSILITRKL